MKTFNKLHLILALILFLCVNLTKAGTKPKSNRDSTICLDISGKVTIDNDKNDNELKVELIYYNTVVDTLFAKTNKKFNFLLKKNSYYTIRISKEGYAPKIISICTNVKTFNPEKEFYKFHFDTELMPLKTAAKLNHEALEFPIAIVTMDESIGGFYINEDYTSNIKRHIHLK